MKFLVTGAAGFIGFHTAARLLDRGETVVGVDNLNSYYDPSLKEARLAILQGRNGFTFYRQDIADRGAMAELFKSERPDKVIHLAAQAGVRPGNADANSYIDSNIVGTQNVLEGCRHTSVQHLVLASSSSVYGGNTAMPFSVHDNVDHPLSLYGATKKANELAGHAYAHLYELPVTGLRFFTVYGPWGRPDMALFRFTQKFSRVNRSRSSITAIMPVTSPTSTTSLMASCARQTRQLNQIRIGTAMRPTRRRHRPRTGSTTSATTTRSS